jgi:hypothetical protein
MMPWLYPQYRKGWENTTLAYVIPITSKRIREPNKLCTFCKTKHHLLHHHHLTTCRALKKGHEDALTFTNAIFEKFEFDEIFKNQQRIILSDELGVLAKQIERDLVRNHGLDAKQQEIAKSIGLSKFALIDQGVDPHTLAMRWWDDTSGQKVHHQIEDRKDIKS